MILELTDGTTTLVLNDNDAYHLPRGTWEPQIAPRTEGLLGSGGPYADVEEEIGIHVWGATAAEVYTNLAALEAMVDATIDWSDRMADYGSAASDPVLLRYQPTGSAESAELEAVVLGGSVSLTSQIHRAGSEYMAGEVTLRLMRRGLWLNASESASSSAGAPGAVLTATLATNLSVPSPLMLELGGFTGNDVTEVERGILLITNHADKIALVEAGDLGDSPGPVLYEDVTEGSGNKATANRVLEVAWSATVDDFSFSTSLSSAFGDDAREIAVFCTAKRDGAAAWNLRGELKARNVWFPTETIVIREDGPVCIGTAATPRGAEEFRIVAYPSGGISTDTLTIDQLWLLRMDDAQSRAIALVQDETLENSFSSNAAALRLTVDPGALTRPAPFVGWRAPSLDDEFPTSYRGDAWITHTGTAVCVVWIAMSSGNWRAVDDAAALLSVTLTATRLAAHRTPQ